MASGRLIIPSIDPVLTSAGVVNPGATLTVYNTGTTTLASLYADQGLTQPIANPQTAGSNGRFYAQGTAIWANVANGYDVVLNLTDGESFTYTDVFLLGQSTSGGSYMPTTGGVFTGSVQGITPATNDNSTNLATTAYVQNNLANVLTTAGGQTLSANLSGVTATYGTSSTVYATTAFVQAALAGSQQIYAQAYITIAAGVLTIVKNTGFSSITRSSAGAYNFTFTTPEADANYLIFGGVVNTTQLACVFPPANKTTGGFAASVLTYNNIPTDCSALSIIVVGT